MLRYRSNNGGVGGWGGTQEAENELRNYERVTPFDQGGLGYVAT